MEENQNKEKKKEKALKPKKQWYKNKRNLVDVILVILLIFTFFYSIGISDEYNKLSRSEESIILERDKLKESLTKNEELTNKLNEENEELKKKIDLAKPWFEMEEKERKEKEAKLKSEKEAKEKKLAEEKEKQAKQGYNTGITYEQLARTPDKLMGRAVKFYGKVIQIIEGDTEVQMRLAVNDDYDKILYCAISKDNLKGTRILENDKITIYGVSTGLITYDSTMGGKISIPGVLIEKYE
jgi:hypothetical protein